MKSSRNLFGTVELRGSRTRRGKSEDAEGWVGFVRQFCIHLRLGTSPNVDINLGFSMFGGEGARPATHQDRGGNKRCWEELGSGFHMLVCIC